MSDEKLELVGETQPCCAETEGGQYDWWAHWETGTNLLETSTRVTRACPTCEADRVLCARLAQAAMDQFSYRPAGRVPRPTAPLPPAT